MDEIVDAGRCRRDEVDTPQAIKGQYSIYHVVTPPGPLDLPSIRVASREAHKAVGDVVLRDESAELAAHIRGVAHCAVPVANDGLGDESGEVVIVLPADTLNSNGDVGGRHGVVADPDLRADKVGLGLLLLGEDLGGVVGRLGGEGAEVLLGEIDKLLVGNTTSSDEDHAVSSVVGLDVVLKVGALDALDVLLGAEDGTSEGLSLESGSVEVVENDLLELLVNLLLLAENDIALTLNGLGLELRVLENVGENVDSGGDVRVERLGVVDGVFALFHVHQ